MFESKDATWAEFKELVSQPDIYSKEPWKSSLFRGISNENYTLSSTLDRALPGCSLAKYNRILRSIVNEVNSFTGSNWEVPLNNFEDMNNQPWSNELPLEFVSYLRHHGYPTPILDWSMSPYVAAFFGIRTCIEGKFSIYHLKLNGITGGELGMPQIQIVGPNIKTHERHYLQQSMYTMCLKKNEEKWVYCSHQEAVTGRYPDIIGKLVKYNIDCSEIEKVAFDLKLANISAYSLFQNDESFLETLAKKSVTEDA